MAETALTFPGGKGLDSNNIYCNDGAARKGR